MENAEKGTFWRVANLLLSHPRKTVPHAEEQYCAQSHCGGSVGKNNQTCAKVFFKNSATTSADVQK